MSLLKWMAKLLLTSLTPKYHFSFSGVRNLLPFLVQTCPETPIHLPTSGDVNLSFVVGSAGCGVVQTNFLLAQDGAQQLSNECGLWGGDVLLVLCESVGR